MRQRRLILVITAIAFAIRLVWVLVADRHGFGFNDSLFYQNAALALSRTGAYVGIGGVPTAQWPPGYPAILATLYANFGEHIVLARILNAVIGAATVPLLYVLVRRQFGHRPAIVAAGMLAIMPGPILWTDLTVTETLYTFLAVLFLLLLTRAAPQWKWALGLGFFLGLVAMVRGEGPVWAIVPAVLWVRSVSWKRAAKLMAVTLAAMAVTLAPWTIRNSRLMHAFVPLSLNSGVTMWAGHNPRAAGNEMYQSNAQLVAYGGTGPQQELAISRGSQHAALEYMVHHPLRELELIPRKLIALSRGDSWAFVWVNAGPTTAVGVGATEAWSVLADAAWFMLLGLTLVGVFTLGRRTWRNPLMTAIATMFVMMLFLYGFLYYGNYRYRLPYEPAMMVVASLVVTRAIDGLRAARATLDLGPTGIDDETGAATSAEDADLSTEGEPLPADDEPAQSAG